MVVLTESKLQSHDGTQAHPTPHPTLWSFHSRSPSSKRATCCHTDLAKLTMIRRERQPSDMRVTETLHSAAQGLLLRPHFCQSSIQTPKGVPCSFLSSARLPSGRDPNEWEHRTVKDCRNRPVDTSACLETWAAGGGWGSSIRNATCWQTRAHKAIVRTCPIPDPKT